MQYSISRLSNSLWKNNVFLLNLICVFQPCDTQQLFASSIYLHKGSRSFFTLRYPIFNESFNSWTSSVICNRLSWILRNWCVVIDCDSKSKLSPVILKIHQIDWLLILPVRNQRFAYLMFLMKWEFHFY